MSTLVLLMSCLFLFIWTTTFSFRFIILSFFDLMLILSWFFHSIIRPSSFLVYPFLYLQMLPLSHPVVFLAVSLLSHSHSRCFLHRSVFIHSGILGYPSFCIPCFIQGIMKRCVFLCSTSFVVIPSNSLHDFDVPSSQTSGTK